MEVQLRETVAGDLPILFAHQADPVASTMAAFPSRDWDAFVAHQAKIQADPEVVTRAVVAGGEVVGAIGSFTIDDAREVGYWIGRDHWGRGIATAALRALLVLEPVRPLWAHVAAHNVGSRRVLEHCGFAVVREQRVDGVDEFLTRLETPDAGGAQAKGGS